jgi:YD repeat-containing protein
MGSWNYRVVRHHHADHPEDDFLAIHRVHYDDEGRIIGMTVDPVQVGGADEGEILRDLQRMREALQKPYLIRDLALAEAQRNGAAARQCYGRLQEPPAPVAEVVG